MNIPLVVPSIAHNRRAALPFLAAAALGWLLSALLSLLFPYLTDLIRASLHLMGFGGGFFITALATSAYSVRLAGRLLLVGQLLVMTAIGLALLN